MLSKRSKALAEAISKTHFERVLNNAAQLSIVAAGIIVIFVALQAAQVILAPVFLAITVGLMFGPVAEALESRGVPNVASAGILVLTLLGVIATAAFLFWGPLSDWAERLPLIWSRIQQELANWREPLESISAVQEQVAGALGTGDTVSVTVEDGAAVTSLALLAPALLAQVGIFLISLLFFLATRDDIRISVLSLCVSRRVRWRAAHVFRDVEQKVSRYLLTITMVNVGVGIVVGTIMWAIGMPTPLLWGALAFVLNYIPFIGQGSLAVLLFLAGIGTFGSVTGALLPVGCYFAVNFIEGNFVTPNLLGRTMTINPFVIFLSISFWLWLWGPVGGLIAVPSVLVAYSVLGHLLPMRAMPEMKRTSRTVAARASRDADAATPTRTPPVPEAPLADAREPAPAARKRASPRSAPA
jgi:predicted PurR-regulated permease PerM